MLLKRFILLAALFGGVFISASLCAAGNGGKKSKKDTSAQDLFRGLSAEFSKAPNSRSLKPILSQFDGTLIYKTDNQCAVINTQRIGYNTVPNISWFLKKDGNVYLYNSCSSTWKTVTERDYGEVHLSQSLAADACKELPPLTIISRVHGGGAAAAYSALFYKINYKQGTKEVESILKWDSALYSPKKRTPIQPLEPEKLIYSKDLLRSENYSKHAQWLADIKTASPVNLHIATDIETTANQLVQLPSFRRIILGDGQKEIRSVPSLTSLLATAGIIGMNKYSPTFQKYIGMGTKKLRLDRFKAWVQTKLSPKIKASPRAQKALALMGAALITSGVKYAGNWRFLDADAAGLLFTPNVPQTSFMALTFYGWYKALSFLVTPESEQQEQKNTIQEKEEFAV